MRVGANTSPTDRSLRGQRDSARTTWAIRLGKSGAANARTCCHRSDAVQQAHQRVAGKACLVRRGRHHVVRRLRRHRRLSAGVGNLRSDDSTVPQRPSLPRSKHGRGSVAGGPPGGLARTHHPQPAGSLAQQPARPRRRPGPGATGPAWGSTAGVGVVLRAQPRLWGRRGVQQR